MKNNKLKLYIDTSVIGGYFDIEFEKETKMLFESIFNNESDTNWDGNEVTMIDDKSEIT